MQNHFYNAKLQALKALLIEYKIIYLICNIYYQLLITFFTIAVLKVKKKKKKLRFNLDALFLQKSTVTYFNDNENNFEIKTRYTTKRTN